MGPVLAALGTCPLQVVLWRLAITDMAPTCFIAVTPISFWHTHREERRWRRWDRWLGVFAAAPPAVLTKDLVGIVVLGAVIFFYVLLTWQWQVLLQVPWLAGNAVFATTAVPWHLLVAQRNTDFPWFYFIPEHVLRYATPETRRAAPLWVFPAVTFVAFAPWIGFVASAFRDTLPRRWREVRSHSPELVFLLVWLAFVLVFFLISKSKLIPYILPGLPPLGVLAGIGVERLHSRAGRPPTTSSPSPRPATRSSAMNGPWRTATKGPPTHRSTPRAPCATFSWLLA